MKTQSILQRTLRRARYIAKRSSRLEEIEDISLEEKEYLYRTSHLSFFSTFESDIFLLCILFFFFILPGGENDYVLGSFIKKLVPFIPAFAILFISSLTKLFSWTKNPYIDTARAFLYQEPFKYVRTS